MRVLAVTTVVLATAIAFAAEQYPADISPPPGTKYPCALTALPKDLPGIPPADRAYINSTYARILRATQAKLVALKALEEKKDVSGAVARYDTAARNIADRLRAEKAPAGLEQFHADVVAAIDLQRAFFRKASAIRAGNGSMKDVYGVPEGREASQKLFAAWASMSARYPRWSEATKDSIYHHLCALDLF